MVSPLTCVRSFQKTGSLKSLNVEYARLKEELKAIQEKRKVCEERILYYLDTNDQPGIKYKDVILLSENKNGRKRCDKKSKLQKGSDFLQNLGISNSKEVFENLMNTLKGSPVSISQLNLMVNKKV
jgi:hypothetical protein